MTWLHGDPVGALSLALQIIDHLLIVARIAPHPARQLAPLANGCGRP